MQKINSFSKKNLTINEKKDDSLKELVEGFSSKEKYSIKKTNEERKTFKKQLIILIVVIIIAVLTIIGASFTIYYAYKHNVGNNKIQQTQILNFFELSKKKKNE